MYSDDGAFAGIDIGGSGVRGGLVDSHGEFLATPVRQEHGKEPLKQQVRRLLDLLIGQEEVPVGLAVAGSMGSDGTIVASPTLPDIVGTRPEDLLSEFRIARVLNDADAALVGESSAGAARDAQRPLGLFLGSGVGGSMMQDGRVLKGGELGHLRIRRNGRSCGCGRRGCLEAYASGSVVRMSYARAEGIELDGATIALRAMEGDRAAIDVFKAQGAALGDALSDLLEIFDADVVVLGGRASEAFELFLPSLESRLARYRRPDVEPVPIVRSQLGGWSGVIGAALWASKGSDGQY